MQRLYKLVKPLFFGTTNTIMTFAALVPLVTINNPYIINFHGFNIHLDMFFFVYFLIEFIIRFRDRTLHGIYMYFDIAALISFLPFFSIFRLLLLARLFSAAFRVKGVALLASIIKENLFLFQSIFYIAIIYMFITSVIVFNIEPETFDNNYLLAFYWSGITLTTVGYGDIYPITPIGQAVSLISSFLGIGIIALPTGVISSNFITKIKQYEQSLDTKPKEHYSSRDKRNIKIINKPEIDAYQKKLKENYYKQKKASKK